MYRAVRFLSACFASVLVIAVPQARAEQGLDHCAASFPGNSLANVPKHSRPSATDKTVLICERSGNTTFFAVEYDPERFAPLWSAYRLADTFGPKGCASMTRKQMDCYFKEKDANACAKRKGGPGDPFHTDATLTKLDIERLTPTAFSGTKHDRGHMAPNSAFSWHACGAYKTFTMANMSAQWGPLNRQIWARLEAQALFWAVHDGPIYVVTGPVWKKFPANKFKAFQDGEVSTKTIPKPGTLLTKANGKKLKLDIPRPTGFYKVILRSGHNGEPDRAIAFLVPHTKQTGLSFWDFVATVELVQDTSELHFGFDDGLKNKEADLAFWHAKSRQAPAQWSPRVDCKQRLPVAGWNVNLSVDERVNLCASERPAP